MPEINGGKIPSKKRGLDSKINCRRVSRPQTHSEYECRKYRISQRKHCGTKQEHLLYTGYPGNGCNLIPDPHGPSNGNNKTAEVDQQYHRRKNKTVFGENVFLAKQGQEDKKSTNNNDSYLEKLDSTGYCLNHGWRVTKVHISFS